MQDTFDIAFDQLIRHEGGFVNDPDDPGGATKYGVSLRWLKRAGLLDLDGDGFSDGDIDLDGDIDIDDIRQMTEGDARKLYRLHWWDGLRIGELPTSPAVQIKLFNLSVNMGSRQAAKCLQRGLASCERLVADDGAIGPLTSAAIREVPAAMLLGATRSEAAGFYRLLIAHKPVFEKYRSGWLKRAYA